MMKFSKKIKKNRGMTYVELIVVLSIFAVMSSIILFNYNAFQEKVDIKNLSNAIAMQIVQAQKSALDGLLPVQAPIALWKPSYGVYFDLSSSGSNQNLVYFTDLNQSGDYTDSSFCPSPGSGECISKMTITKGDYISDISVFYANNTPAPATGIKNLSITFTRPSSGAVIKSTAGLSAGISYVQITVSSPASIKAKIEVYRSGRIQIN